MKLNVKRVSLLSAAALIGLVACKDDTKKETAEAEKIPGIVLENMDTNVSPKDDFYNYVNGNWMRTNTIPEDQSRWGGFGVLRKSTRNDVLEIVKTAKELGTYAEGTDLTICLNLFHRFV